jgi:oligopeptide/dipeptide ABC transporter ATP-binding protein
MSEKVLDVKGLITHFFTREGVVRAVDGVDLHIQPNEAVGLVGESGCGKTQTAFSVLRIIPIPGKILAGNVLFKGTDLLKLSEKEMQNIRGGDISITFQDPMTFLNPVMKVKDQIAEGLTLHQKISKKEAYDRVVEVLKDMRIPYPVKVADSYPHQLSGGMRQRVLIAMAMSSTPSILIADEPTTALDVTIQAQILNLMNDLKKEFETSILLITHDLGIVADLCDRVYVMYAGKIVESADVFQTFEEPAHPYTKGLLRSVLSIDEFKKELVTIEGVVPQLINPPLGCRFHPRCEYAMEICRQKIPQTKTISNGHEVACWLFDGEENK